MLYVDVMKIFKIKDSSLISGFQAVEYAIIIYLQLDGYSMNEPQAGDSFTCDCI